MTKRRIYNSKRWADIRRLVLQRHSHLCYWCGDAATEVDHLVSVVEGGPAYSPSNLVAACKRCNASRGNHVERARRRGVFLGARRRGAITAQNPCTEPVFLTGNKKMTPQVEIPDTLGDAAVYGAIRDPRVN